MLWTLVESADLVGSMLAKKSQWIALVRIQLKLQRVYFNFTESLKLCSDGSVPEKCEVNPCETARCPDVEGAVCVADFCGGCRDRWIHDGMEVTKKCRGNPLKLYA